MNRNRNSKHVLQRGLLYLAVLAIVIWTIAPYLWLIISSFSYRIDLLQVPLRWFPSRVTFENYHELFFSRGGANVNARTTDGMTALSLAANTGHTNIEALLRRNGGTK